MIKTPEILKKISAGGKNENIKCDNEYKSTDYSKYCNRLKISIFK